MSTTITRNLADHVKCGGGVCEIDDPDGCVCWVCDDADHTVAECWHDAYWCGLGECPDEPTCPHLI